MTEKKYNRMLPIIRLCHWCVFLVAVAVTATVLWFHDARPIAVNRWKKQKKHRNMTIVCTQS